MDRHTYENWVLIKKLMEASGKTDTYYYKRACAIASSKRDPGPMPPTFDGDAS